VAHDLDDELRGLTPAPAAAPLSCLSCSHGYPAHPDAGHCTDRVGGFSSPAAAVPCPCPGFRWVDPGGPPVGSYSEPPAVRAR
jgi:hypothetical protein